MIVTIIGGRVDNAPVVSTAVRGRTKLEVVGTVRYNSSISPELAQRGMRTGSPIPYVEKICRVWHRIGPQLDVAPFEYAIALSSQPVAIAQEDAVEAQHAANLADVVNTSPSGQYIGLVVADATTNPTKGSFVIAEARAVIGEGRSVVVVEVPDCPITPHRPNDIISKATRHFNMLIGIEM